MQTLAEKSSGEMCTFMLALIMFGRWDDRGLAGETSF